MFILHESVPNTRIMPGVQLQTMGHGEKMTVLHFTSQDGVEAPAHSHEHEQFGYVLRGALEITVGDETAILHAGDCYLIPSNAPHSFRTIGVTEALDIFSPVRKELPMAGNSEGADHERK